MLPDPGYVGKSQVDHLDVLVLDGLENVLDGSTMESHEFLPSSSRITPTGGDEGVIGRLARYLGFHSAEISAPTPPLPRGEAATIRNRNCWRPAAGLSLRAAPALP